MQHGQLGSRSGSSTQGQMVVITRRTNEAGPETVDPTRVSRLPIGEANTEGNQRTPTKSSPFASPQITTKGTGMTRSGPPSIDQHKIDNGNTNTTRGTMTPGTNLPLPSSITLTCEHYNCHGFKQAGDYVMERLVINDVVCLTETWLRPYELFVVHDTIRKYSDSLGKNCVIVWHGTD